MDVQFSQLDLDCYAALEYLSSLDEADIRDAHGDVFARPMPESIAADVYSELVRQEEAGW